MMAPQTPTGSCLVILMKLSSGKKKLAFVKRLEQMMRLLDSASLVVPLP